MLQAISMDSIKFPLHTKPESHDLVGHGGRILLDQHFATQSPEISCSHCPERVTRCSVLSKGQPPFILFVFFFLYKCQRDSVLTQWQLIKSEATFLKGNFLSKETDAF